MERLCGRGRLHLRNLHQAPATAQHRKNAVEDLPHIHTSGPPSRQSFRYERVKNGPFGVREITGIEFHRGSSSSLSTSFVFNRFYCTTFPLLILPKPLSRPFRTAFRSGFLVVERGRRNRIRRRSLGISSTLCPAY